jgi:(1->4)-alpha-D-glucan 1-alpha-D-glucosylmutase
VEKILQPGEHLPENWPVEGTVGYDFLNQVNGLFIKTANEKIFTGFFLKFTDEPADAGKMVREKKRLVLKTLFVTEVRRLVDLLAGIAVRRKAHQNFSREELQKALIEYVACFPVYRTYVRVREEFVDETDLNYIKATNALAKKTCPDLPREIFDFLSELLQLLFHGEFENEFVARFQQLTGPAMAKGVEDTAFYCFNRFTSLNEVGGNPGKFGVSDDEFHDFCRDQAGRAPQSMLCTSTHDTKRSEDVRARLNVLSEIPEEWSATVLRWSRLNERHRREQFPDRNLEYHFYQTLIGVWPISLKRMLAYLEKAACEAKQHTDWNYRNAQYDEALKKFVTATLADEAFVEDLEQFLASLAQAAQINSLAQTLIKLCAPGVPDIYQGNEIWDFSLVDPDNRRPVDFGLRKHLLAEAKHLSAEEAWKRRDEGMPKLWLIQRTLSFRSRHEKIFQNGYEPLYLNGTNADQVVAFLRGGAVIIVVPRFTQSQPDRTAVLPLPSGHWRNEFTGETFAGDIVTNALFGKFPVSLLIRE